jgi:hypothetical protein
MSGSSISCNKGILNAGNTPTDICPHLPDICPGGLVSLSLSLSLYGCYPVKHTRYTYLKYGDAECVRGRPGLPETPRYGKFLIKLSLFLSLRVSRSLVM